MKNCIPFLLLSCCLSISADVVWNKANNFEGWEKTTNCTVSPTDNGLLFTFTANGPNIANRNVDIDPRQYNTITYTYRATGPVKHHGYVFYAKDGQNFSDYRLWKLPVPKADGEWHTVTVTGDVLSKPWTWFNGGNIKSLRFDPTYTGEGTTYELRELKFSYQEGAMMTFDNLVLAQLSDPQIGFKDYDAELARFRQEIDIINNSDCQAVVICGDMMHITNRETLTVFKKELSRLKIPAYIVAGNHDVGQKNSRPVFEEFFGPTFYAADMPSGGYRLIVLDSELWQHPQEPLTAQMDAFLQKELDAAKTSDKKIILAMHAPIFIESPDEKEEYFNLPKPRRKWLLDKLKQYPVVAFLTGHTHKTFTYQWNGILFSSAETTSVSFDKVTYGFRRFVFDHDMIRYNTVPIK